MFLPHKLSETANCPWRNAVGTSRMRGMARPRIRDLPDLADLARPGARIALRVTPKAARDSLTRKGDTLRATVTAVPEDGRANEAVRALLAAAMGVPPSRLSLERGHKSRDKLFRYSAD